MIGNAAFSLLNSEIILHSKRIHYGDRHRRSIHLHDAGEHRRVVPLGH
jgi:hypothetical protein